MAYYSSYLNSGLSFATIFGNSLHGVTNPTNFANTAIKDGYGITASTFTSIESDIEQCLKKAQ
jgi:hypothetical protein